MRTLAFSISLLFALPLPGETLGDVRQALSKLTARDAVRATFELEQIVANEGKFDNAKFSGKASVGLEGDANGFRLVFDRTLLEQMERERLTKAKNQKATTPTVSAISEIDAADAAEALDFAPVLLRMLEGAKVQSQGQGAWQGKPVRTMVLRLANRIDEEDKGRVKIADNRLTLWIGPDHVPVAAEHMLDARFSFLVFKGETKQKRSWHLQRSGDRLLRARYESTETSSGMGQKGNNRIVATVRPLQGL